MPFFEVVHGPAAKGGPAIPLSKGSVGPAKAPPPPIVPPANIPANQPAPETSPVVSRRETPFPAGTRIIPQAAPPTTPREIEREPARSEPLSRQEDDQAADATDLPETENSGGKVLVVSMNTVLIAAAVVLAAIAGVWSIGYMSGQSSEREKLPANSSFNSENTPIAPPISDPMNEIGGGTNPLANASRPPAADRNPPKTHPVADSRSATTPAASTGTASSQEVGAEKDGSVAVFSTDPRQTGVNYLELGVLRYEDAVEAIQYLTANGLPVAAVPTNGVDPASARAKNLNCLLFVLEGSPSQGYKSDTNVRRRAEIESQVRRLGKSFQKDQKGASDFADTFWRRK